MNEFQKVDTTLIWGISFVMAMVVLILIFMVGWILKLRFDVQKIKAGKFCLHVCISVCPYIYLSLSVSACLSACLTLFFYLSDSVCIIILCLFFCFYLVYYAV